MAASDSNVQAAKNRYERGSGEPLTGFISPGDAQAAMDDLQDGWQADIADLAMTSWIGGDRDAYDTITDPANQIVNTIRIDDDGSDTLTWPDRLVFRFQQGIGSGTYYRTGGFNEYGEGRFDSGRPQQVALRAHGHLDGAQTGHIFEVRDKRGGSTVFAVDRDAVQVMVEPTLPTHAATKAYVDQAVALVVQRLGLDPDTPPPDDAHPDHLARWRAMFG